MLQERQDERKTRKRSGKISPSTLGRCYRYQYWYRKGEEPSNPPDARALRVFKVGDLFHTFIQQFFETEDVERIVEVDDIKGYADIVTKDEVVDIKSQHSRAFWYMKKDNYDVAKEKEPQILQVMTYVYLLKKKYGRLVFVSKDDLCVEEYVFDIENWRERVEKELALNRAYWAKEELPEAEPRAYGGQECKYCSYRDRCKNEQKQKTSENK